MNRELHGSKEDLLYVRSPEAIRERSQQIFDLTCQSKTNFIFDEQKLGPAVDFVCEEISKNYPDLKVPFHSRLRHFEILGENWTAFINKLSSASKLSSLCDLTVLSVLLDAGSGPKWKFFDELTNRSYARSEGLAVASLRWFEEGFFSADREDPYQVTTAKLRLTTKADFEKAFQISEDNPLEGVEGRVSLLNRLGETLESHDGSRICDILGSLPTDSIEASDVLTLVQDEMGDIWPGRLMLNGVNLGDVWQYERLGSGVEGLVPFHKLSQWLSYSIIDVLMDSGRKVVSLDNLTGLPEYRNGGLFLDLGVLTVKDARLIEKAHLPSSDLVIEWRALTIVLLDRLAEKVRERLNALDLPLCAILQGGTWSAGRRLAQEKRRGLPPIQIISDGTVF